MTSVKMQEINNVRHSLLKYYLTGIPVEGKMKYVFFNHQRVIIDDHLYNLMKPQVPLMAGKSPNSVNKL